MNLILKYSFLFLSVLLIRNCSRTQLSLSPADYVSWVEDEQNGFCPSKKIGQLQFDLQYKPLEYIVLKDNAGAKLSSAEMKKQVSDISDMQYFTFRIASEKGGDLLRSDAMEMAEFSNRLAYFSSGMQKDIRLIEGNDTLSCLLFHFERSFGIDPRSTFVIGFPLGKKDGPGGISTADKIFLFDDHELGAGPVMLAIQARQISMLPTLNLE